MKKVLLTTGLIGLLVAAGVVGAAMEHKSTKPVVKLYASPTKSSEVVKAYSQAQPLTPFYRQGDWVKVGNSEDGMVGWVKIGQLRHSQFGQPHTMPAVVTQKGQSPKTTTTVTNTPYGPMKTTTQIGETNGVKYKIVQSNLEADKMTKAQKTAYAKHINAEQRAIDMQIQRNIERMNRTFRQMEQQFNNFPQIEIYFPQVQPNASKPAQATTVKKPG